jgi:glycosyltransferase involved in cell wall biosynthesis
MLTEQWLGMGQSVQFVEKPSYRSLLERGTFHPTPEHVIRPWPSLGAGRTPSEPRLAARLLRRELEQRAPLEESIALVVSPLWLPWLERLPFRHVVYDCIDDVRVMTPSPEFRLLYASWEKRLIERASAVVSANDTLAERILRQHPDLPITTIRNGCPADDFARRADAAPRPADLPAETERPLVGFVGALYEWIDWELIERVSEKRPEVEFVFIGPQREGHSPPQSLRQRENVHFLGARPYHEVPAYLGHFDLCWLPFRRDGISEAANPVKIYEYLAAGKPVVSTPVADMESYERQVDFGRNAEEIAELIRLGLVKVLASSEPGAQSATLGRRAFAQRQDWRTRAADYIDFIGRTFGRRAG